MGAPTWLQKSINGRPRNRSWVCVHLRWNASGPGLFEGAFFSQRVCDAPSVLSFVCCWSLTMDEQPTWWTKWPQQIVYSLRAARRQWNHQLTGISANQRTHTTDFDPRIWSVQTLSRPNTHCSLSVDPRPMLFRFAGPHWPGLHVSGRQ